MDQRVKVLDWPVKLLILSKLRNKDTPHLEFVHATNRLSHLLWEWVLGFEHPIYVETPRQGVMSEYTHYSLPEQKFTVVSILRSAEAMVHVGPLLTEGNFSFGKILIQRDEESLEKLPKLFYKKLPKDISQRIVYVADNMLGTGSTAAMAIDVLISEGCEVKNMRFVNIISCNEGIERLRSRYPELTIYTAQIDPVLSESKYIVPGVGDFGDRYYNTPH